MFLSDKLDLILSVVAEDPSEENMQQATLEISRLVSQSLLELVEDLKAKHHNDHTALPIIRANIKRLNNTVNAANNKTLILGGHLLKQNMVLLLCELNKYPLAVYENIT